MKKLFIALLFLVVLFIGLPFYNVNAMPITYDVPFSSVPDTLGLLEDILNGGKINIKDMSTVEDVLNHYAESIGAKNFLSRQANKISSKLSKMALDGELTINPNNNLVIPITISDLAYRMGYNPYWYQQYNKSDIEVNPLPLVESQCNVINGDGLETFFTSNEILYNSRYNYYSMNTWSLDYSFFSSNENRYSPIFSNCSIFNKSSLYINTVDSTNYNLTYTFTLIPNFAACNPGSGSFEYWVTFGNRLNQFDTSNMNDYTYWGGFTPSASNPATISGNITDTLTNILNYISYHFHNVNIYVNGVCISAGYGNDSFLEAPDVIQVGDLPNWTYDVFFPKIDGLEGLSINQFLEWLQTQLDDPDVNFVDLGMLIADAVPLLVIDDDDPETTPTTRPITLEDTRPVIDVIDDPTVTSPTPNPDNPTSTPFPLPPIPTFPIPSDIPGVGIPVDHTVLAEIVDATQNVVPQELMALIWSTFGLLVVGGLIYILHK